MTARRSGDRRTPSFLVGKCWLFLALGACSSTGARHVRGPDGQENWVVITCKDSQANCYERAGQECTKGYDIGDKDGRTGEIVDPTSGVSVPVYMGELLIKCH
jgi:hypothetical protein